MASEFAALSDWVEKVEKITDPAAVKRILNKAGAAGKKAALDAAGNALGGDRRFSHWRGKPALSAGYDLGAGSQVDINFRPAGMWKLAEDGRRGSGRIVPKRRGRAVKTPFGPRAASSYGPSSGLKAYSKATRDAATDVPKAAHEQFVDEIRRVI